MRTVVRTIVTLYGGAILMATGGSAAIVLVIELIYWDSFAGIGGVTGIASRVPIPLIFVLCLIWASVVLVSLLWKARRLAGPCGLTFLQYFDLSQEDRERRVKALGEGAG